MLALKDLLEAVGAAVASKLELDSDAVYKQYQPKNFKRPSILITTGKITTEKISHDELGFQMEVSVNGFVKVDEYHYSHFDDLIAEVALIQSVFYDGYLKVGDRNPHVIAMNSSYEYDFCTVNLVFEWTEVLDGETYPLMGEFNFTQNIKEV